MFGNLASHGKKRRARHVNPPPGIQDGFSGSGVAGDEVRAVGVDFGVAWSA
jgi:hypothetical protein